MVYDFTMLLPWLPRLPCTLQLPWLPLNWYHLVIFCVSLHRASARDLFSCICVRCAVCKVIFVFPVCYISNAWYSSLKNPGYKLYEGSLLFGNELPSTPKVSNVLKKFQFACDRKSIQIPEWCLDVPALIAREVVEILSEDSSRVFHDTG